MKSQFMLSPLEVAILMGTGRDVTYAALKDGTIPAIRVGRAWRIPAHRLAAEVLGCTVEDIEAALREAS